MTGELRRAQLLRVARDLFTEIGFHETTTLMIASRACVTEPVLYRHFPSKLCLFHDILEEIVSEATSHFEQIANGRATGADRLLAIVENFPHFSREHSRDFGMVDRAAAAATDEKTRQILLEYYAAFEQVVERLVHEGQADGSVHASVEASSLSWMLIMTGVGLTMLSSLSAPFLSQERAPQELRDLVRAMITGRS